jgi:hypothetical protein
MRATPLLSAVALLTALSLACTGTTTPGEATVEVDDCAGDADVDDVTYIVWEFEDSAHEMITCGSLTFQLIWALIQTADSLLTDPASAPSAFSYADSTYTTTGQGVVMDLTVLYGPQSPGGTGGEPVGADLFDPDSYLVDADGTDNGDGTVTVTFSSPGPLVALLGQGDSPASPLTLTDDDLGVFAENLAGLKILSAIHVDDEVTLSTITYDINNPAAFIGDMLQGMQMNMEVVTASGSRADLGQTLSTTTWDVVYGDVAGTLDGTIEIEVTGGDFDFTARYDYQPIDPYPSVTISCLP